MADKFKLLFLLMIFGPNISIETINVELSVESIHSLITEDHWNCTDLINYFLRRSYTYNPLIRAIINYNPNVFKEAHELDDYYYLNKRLYGNLHCVPVLVKDNIDVSGIATTGGIKALRNSVPNKDATVIQRLRKEGAIFISKANLAELASGVIDSETGGLCRNPWNLNKDCGPSSTGTGAGISSGFAVIGLGTDTDGSIQNPSTVNGLFGLRPPLNTININGVIPLFERQDTVGPLTHYIDDLVLTFSIMLGDKIVYQKYKDKEESNKKFKVAYVKQFLEPFNLTNIFGTFLNKFDDEVNATLQKTIKNMRDSNIEIVEVDLNSTEFELAKNFTQNIIIERIAEKCGDACFKHPFDRYLADSERFQADAPYHSFEDLLKSPLLSSYWRNHFNATNYPDAENFCEQKCRIYDIERQKFKNLVNSWYKSSNADAFIFPSISELPYNLNITEPILTVSHTFMSPYTGYATLNLPAGFSKPTKDSPNGLPIGIQLLSLPETLVNTFKIAKIYETKYLKNRKLPPYVPQLPIKCILTESNHSNRFKLNFDLIFLCSFLAYLTTLKNAY